MNELFQLVLTEPVMLFVGSSIVTGFGWCLKKLYDLDNRLGRIEERCKIHFSHKP